MKSGERSTRTAMVARSSRRPRALTTSLRSPSCLPLFFLSAVLLALVSPSDARLYYLSLPSPTSSMCAASVGSRVFFGGGDVLPSFFFSFSFSLSFFLQQTYYNPKVKEHMSILTMTCPWGARGRTGRPGGSSLLNLLPLSPFSLSLLSLGNLPL